MTGRARGVGPVKYCDYCGGPFRSNLPHKKFCIQAHRRAFNSIVDRHARLSMRAVRESVREIIRARGVHRGGE